MKKSDLPLDYKPSVKDAQWFIDNWQKLPSYTDQERALDKLFMELCPKNNRIEDVLIKCSALNDFYSTNIFGIHTLAEHILSLNIDERLHQVDYSLIGDIAKVEVNGKEHCFYSFATKYCSHHLPEKYAIYDNYVEKVLLSMNKKEPFSNFKREDLKDYETYMSVIRGFSQHFGLTQFSIKQLDQYLWQLGKWYFNQYGLTYKYYNREESSPFSKNDIRSKFWYGEMMFVTGHQSVGYWKEQGKKWLQTADDSIKQLAKKYTPEQFGLITYIYFNRATMCPYDDLSWIIEY
ncbi:MAG: hypothetical protein F083_1932 [bacterium F083]|nr:MAG: hypothetical protein F083_1932 [bacterium F083]MBQ3843494.1 hypothetical protein [Bacteroidales bacterium]MBQ6209972.1 hypothetical protein [Prevotella sp.]MBR3730732.1 hypothetical protein [Bacteroidales bacterium]